MLRHRWLPPFALVAVLLVAGCSAGGGFGANTKTMTADATVTEAVTSVEVTDAASGSIRVSPGSGQGVGVHRTVHYRDEVPPRPSQRVSGGVLTFDRGCENCYIDYELTVPASAGVTLGSASGDVDVRGVASADVRTASGRVTAESIAGGFSARTSSGDITGGGLGGGLGGGEVRVDTQSGATELRFVAAPGSVTARAVSGDVRVTVPAGRYRVEAATKSGQRQVDVPSDPASGARIAVESLSGNVTVSAR
ncbi:DUF4097 family beta strand repeat-containing protein [Pseudonocardia acaciae]|uniref:DUF4097 family beta strand repeat-containing protein n=1 Tax=Pseudonocardia acaciae TaxID=551276 RepID=UPI000491CB37|nr:DUF4097 family beta strand repeat-containing protein [Pseudonocardia acaciae]